MNKKSLLILVIVGIVIIGAIVLLAVNKKEKKSDISIEELYTKVSEAVTLPEYVEPSVSDLELFYDIALDEQDSYIFKIAEVSPSVETLAIFKLADEAKCATLKEKLEAVKKTQCDTMKDYSPENYKIAINGVVKVSGPYVYLVMSEKLTEITKVLDENI